MSSRYYIYIIYILYYITMLYIRRHACVRSGSDLTINLICVRMKKILKELLRSEELKYEVLDKICVTQINVF